MHGDPNGGRCGPSLLTEIGVTGSVNRASIAFPSIKSADAIVEGAETVTGNYRTTSGTPGDGLQSPRTVPTAPTSCVEVDTHTRG